MSTKEIRRTHSVHKYHLGWTTCGRVLQLVERDDENPSCLQCRKRAGLPVPPRHIPTPAPIPLNYPGAPGRCEMIVRGGTGLELCGRTPCAEHQT